MQNEDILIIAWAGSIVGICCIFLLITGCIKACKKKEGPSSVTKVVPMHVP